MNAILQNELKLHKIKMKEVNRDHILLMRKRES